MNNLTSEERTSLEERRERLLKELREHPFSTKIITPVLTNINSILENNIIIKSIVILVMLGVVLYYSYEPNMVYVKDNLDFYFFE